MSICIRYTSFLRIFLSAVKHVVRTPPNFKRLFHVPEMLASMNDEKNIDRSATDKSSPVVPSPEKSTGTSPSVLKKEVPLKNGLLQIAGRQAGKEENLYDIVYRTMCKHNHFYTQHGEVMERITGSKASYRRVCSSMEYISNIIISDGYQKHSCALRDISSSFFTVPIFEGPNEKTLPFVMMDYMFMELGDCFYNNHTFRFHRELPANTGTDIYCPKITSKNYVSIMKLYNIHNSVLLNNIQKGSYFPSMFVQNICQAIPGMAGRPRGDQTPVLGLVIAEILGCQSVPRMINELPVVMIILTLCAKDSRPLQGAVTTVSMIEWEQNVEFPIGDNGSLNPYALMDEDNEVNSCTKHFVTLNI